MHSEIGCRLLEVNVEEFIKKIKLNGAIFVGDWVRLYLAT